MGISSSWQFPVAIITLSKYCEDPLSNITSHLPFSLSRATKLTSLPSRSFDDRWKCWTYCSRYRCTSAPLAWLGTSLSNGKSVKEPYLCKCCKSQRPSLTYTFCGDIDDRGLGGRVSLQHSRLQRPNLHWRTDVLSSVVECHSPPTQLFFSKPTTSNPSSDRSFTATSPSAPSPVS